MEALKTPRKSLASRGVEANDGEAMHGKNLPATSWLDRLKQGVLLFCLLAPSVWMIATIPPLWRDADAYVQLTQDPRVSKFWGHAPVYSYLAKVPLFVGEQWERLRGQPPVPPTIASQLPLTDSGIAILIVAQHLGLGLAALFFIVTVTRLFWGRLLLSLLWASHALFYTFAHCVGSETLSLILIIWLAARAVRLVRSTIEPPWTDWYFFAGLLLICMLTRDLNSALVAVLPLAFLIPATWHLITRRHTRKGASYFTLATIAVAVGVACLALAPSVPVSLARKTRLHPHSRVGYTFLWRLHSINDLPPDARAALFRKVSERAPSEQVRRLIQLYAQMMSEHPDPLDATAFGARAVEIFGGIPHWEELDAGFKQMALTFLWPATPELTNLIKKDFLAVMKLPSTEVSDYLFSTTAYYFYHQDGMPGLAHLSTYGGGASVASLEALPSEHDYFHFWQRLSYRGAVALWFALLLILIWAARRNRSPIAATVGLAVAFVLVGLFQFGEACVVHDYEPRFSISMWELLLLSLFLLLGNLFDLLLPEPRTLGPEGSPPGS
jgi:hypothetical protein